MLTLEPRNDHPAQKVTTEGSASRLMIARLCRFRGFATSTYLPDHGGFVPISLVAAALAVKGFQCYLPCREGK